MHYLDLHIHTTASDGQYTPSQIINRAKSANLAMSAVTDHDTVEGIPEAKQQAKILGVNFIPGVEISTQEEEEIHILGYGIDEIFPELVERCREYTWSRLDRGKRICDFFVRRGILMQLEEVAQIAGSGSMGRPHFAAWLQAHGYVSTRNEAFQKYLDTPEFHVETDRIKPTPQEAVELIQRSGGKAVLAHPGLLKMSARRQKTLIRGLKAAGLDGVECFYSKHTREQTEHYLSLADKYDLKITCGSDFHGEKVKPDVKLGMEFDTERYRKRLLFNHLL